MMVFQIALAFAVVANYRLSMEFHDFAAIALKASIWPFAVPGILATIAWVLSLLDVIRYEPDHRRKVLWVVSLLLLQVLVIAPYWTLVLVRILKRPVDSVQAAENSPTESR
jgi:ABC-type Fe3+ transport system permease subunit